MASNRVLQKVPLNKTIIMGNQAVRLSIVTVTESWTRADFAVQATGDGFAKALQFRKEPLPEGTVELAVKQVFFD